jgi:AcrR family transcriptional regulator
MPPRPAKPAVDAIDGEAPAVVRRAPFSDNPRVGARGQRAQQRILEAALEVFGEVGYHDCGIIRITEVAGCSRAAFYQYFSSKEDVFRHLAGQVARQLMASAESMDAVTPDADGWATLRAWVERQGDIYTRYEPVFRAFQAAAESDDAVASGSNRIQQRTVAAVRSKLTTTTLPSRHVDAVIAVLQECMTRTRHVTGVLRAALPSGAYPAAQVDDALTDVVHRTIFGLDPDVNVRPEKRKPAPLVPLAGVEPLDPAEHAELSRAGARTLANLLKAGHDVLVTRGYHGTRVDDIVAAAGVSHGAFYRYFQNKDHLIRLLALRATQTVVDAFTQIPDIAGAPGAASSTALRQWLRRYNAAYASETAMIRVWVDATAHDPQLSAESAAAVDWGRRRLVRFLRGRGFDDVDTEAVVGVALVDGFGARRREAAIVDATAHVIERGLLGFGGRKAGRAARR